MPDPYPVLATVLDAVVTELDAVKPMFVIADYDAEWSYTPFFDPRTDKGVKLQIASALVDIEPVSRADATWSFNVGIAVYSSVKTNKTDVNRMVLLVQQIADHFRLNTHLSQFDQAAVTESKVDLLYDPESLKEKNTFLGVVRLTVQVVR